MNDCVADWLTDWLMGSIFLSLVFQERLKRIGSSSWLLSTRTYVNDDSFSPLFSFQVVQSLRLQSSKNYSELGSCPTLHSGSRPLLARTLLSEEANKPVEEMVQTATGKILVARQGDPRRPAIITYHDVGLNYLTNFQVRHSTENPQLPGERWRQKRRA